MELKTPLYDAHVKAGGKIVPFGGYLLPVQYETGVIKEHMAVRTQAGLFDVSHMGEILCEGKDALANLQMILTNSFLNMVDGQARYSPMCNEHGGTVDDLIVYKKSEDHYFIVVNAANKDKDYQWMLDHQFGEVEFTDVSDEYAQLALQGPEAIGILRKMTDESNIPAKNYHAVFGAEVAGIPCIVSKTGYTGEDGVELYFDSSKAEEKIEKFSKKICGKEYRSYNYFPSECDGYLAVESDLHDNITNEYINLGECDNAFELAKAIFTDDTFKDVNEFRYCVWAKFVDKYGNEEEQIAIKIFITRDTFSKFNLESDNADLLYQSLPDTADYYSTRIK